MKSWGRTLLNVDWLLNSSVFSANNLFVYTFFQISIMNVDIRHAALDISSSCLRCTDLTWITLITFLIWFLNGFIDVYLWWSSWCHHKEWKLIFVTGCVVTTIDLRLGVTFVVNYIRYVIGGWGGKYCCKNSEAFCTCSERPVIFE